MAVSFFGGQDGAGARVWSAGKFVANQQDQEQLRARIRELESLSARSHPRARILCTDVLVAGVDIGLPQHLLNQFWAAVGHGELPHAFNVDLPPAPPRPVESTQAQKVVVAPEAFTDKAPGTAPAKREPMEIPDIPLTANPLTAKDADPTAQAAAGRAEAAHHQENRVRRRRRPDDAGRACPHSAAREFRSADGERRSRDDREARRSLRRGRSARHRLRDARHAAGASWPITCASVSRR